jgi:hypothetical protein
MKSRKVVVLSSLVFSGALAMYAGSAWSQGKSSGSSSSSPSSDIKDPQTLPSGDPAARQPGAGNPEPGQNKSGGKSKSSDSTSTDTAPSKMKSSDLDETTKGKSSSKGSSTDPQTLPSGDPAARQPGAGNPEPGQSRGGAK